MKFKNFVLDQINSGLFECELGIVNSDAEQSFFMFNYLNSECGINFIQAENALWSLNEDLRQIEGFMPISQKEYFCYLLYVSNLIFKNQVSIKDIFIILDNYLIQHPVISWYNDFFEFTKPLRDVTDCQ